jgi:hypothetical protein
MSERIRINLQPRLFSFMCENGAYKFYDISNPARRKLPANFISLRVARISQVQANDILKAFLSGEPFSNHKRRCNDHDTKLRIEPFSSEFMDEDIIDLHLFVSNDNELLEKRAFQASRRRTAA